MDGILDADNDVFAEIPQPLRAPLAWVKTTISSFRICEQIAYFQEAGWTVRPLLICRDVREVYASLRTKPYGRNGTSAEDPPLRLRLRRFKEDWELFRAQGWPILHYDRFLADPEHALRSACAQLDLAWDPGMMSWPKPRSAVSDTRHGNGNFHKSCGQGLRGSLKVGVKPLESLVIPAGELAWLEAEFAQFNLSNGYPEHVELRSSHAALTERALPTFAATRRFKWQLQQKPLKYLLHKFGLRCRAG